MYHTHADCRHWASQRTSHCTRCFLLIECPSGVVQAIAICFLGRLDLSYTFPRIAICLMGPGSLFMVCRMVLKKGSDITAGSHSKKGWSASLRKSSYAGARKQRLRVQWHVRALCLSQRASGSQYFNCSQTNPGGLGESWSYGETSYLHKGAEWGQLVIRENTESRVVPRVGALSCGLVPAIQPFLPLQLSWLCLLTSIL